MIVTLGHDSRVSWLVLRLLLLLDMSSLGCADLVIMLVLVNHNLWQFIFVGIALAHLADVAEARLG